MSDLKKLQSEEQELLKQKENLLKKLQEIQKKTEEVKEENLAREALIGEGCDKIAKLIGYDEGGLIHKRIDWRLNLIIKRHRKKHPKEKLVIAINGCRGFGKSTIWQRCKLVKDLIKYPRKSYLLGSSKRDLAVDMLAPIKRIYETNSRIKKYYPNMVGTKKWTSDEILTQPAEAIENPDNNYSLETWGVDANLASKRYDEILIDDIVGKDNVVNSKDLENASRAIPRLLPLLKQGGILWFFYMHWGYKDWYYENVEDYFKDYPHFYHVIIPDVVCDKEGRPLNKHGEVVDEDSPERTPNFPEKFPLHVLDADRKLLKDAYWAQYRQYPRKTENRLMDPDQLVTMDEAEYKLIVEGIKLGNIPEEELVLFVDNANTVSQQSNAWSIGLWRYNRSTFDLIYFRKTKFSLDAAADELCRIVQMFNLSKIHGEKSGLEGNLQFALRPRLNRLGLQHVVFYTESHEGINKKIRILSMQPFLNQRVLRVPPEKYCFHPFDMNGEKVNQLKLMKEEMLLFPADATNIPDDMIDQFGYIPKIFGVETEFMDTSVMDGTYDPQAFIAKAAERVNDNHIPNEDEDGYDEEAGEFVEPV